MHSALLVLLVAAWGISLPTALLVPAASLPPAAKSQPAGPERIKIETSVKAESDAQDIEEVLHVLPAAHPAPVVAASTLATPLAVSAAASSSPPTLAATASPELPARTGAKADDASDVGAHADAVQGGSVGSETSAQSERIKIETTVKSESEAQDVEEVQHPALAVAASTAATQLVVPAAAQSSHASQQVQGFAIEQHLKEVEHDIAKKAPPAPAAGMTARALPASSTAPKAAPTKTVHLASKKTLRAQRSNLRNLLSKMKRDISRFNKNEADDQDSSDSHIKKIQKRLEQDKARLADPKLRPFMRELLQNRTKEEQRDIDFWSHGRKLQKRMYHSNIKITHGLMSRVKGVLQVFDQALVNGKISEEAAQQLKSAVNGVNGLQ